MAIEEIERAMMRFALRGLLGRKLRTVLTALAIILGVAMVSGTFVLTDSITGAFDCDLLVDVQEHRRSRSPASRPSSSATTGPTGPVVRRVAAARRCKALPDVAAALGGVQGDAHLIGKNGKAIVFGGAPNIGFSVDPDAAAVQLADARTRAPGRRRAR